MLATIVLGVVMLFQKVDNISGMMRSIQTGIKGVMPVLSRGVIIYARIGV